MQLDIFNRMKKFPGGLMVFPMLLTAIINTFFPEALQIGGPATAVFSSKGTLCVAGIVLFISGAKFKVNQLGKILKVGGLYAIVKLIIGFGTGVIFMHYFGLAGVFGISAVAFVSVMYSTNPGVYMALASEYGDELDEATFALVTILCMQAVPVVILELGSGAGFDIMNVVNVLAPFLVGMIFGNLDPNIAKFLAPGTNICLPFLGFCFGASVNLITAFQAGLVGLLITAIYLVINIPIMFLADKLILKRSGFASVAMCSVAGISISIPALMAANRPEYAPYVDVATSQVALAMILTSVIIPPITKLVVKKYGDHKGNPGTKQLQSVKS